MNGAEGRIGTRLLPISPHAKMTGVENSFHITIRNGSQMKRFLLLLLVVLSVSCKASPKVVWKFKTGAHIYGSPVIAGKLLIIGSTDHWLYALDLDTGKVVWKTDLGDRILSKPLLDSGLLYVGNTAGTFFCLDAPTGAIRWRFQGGGLIHYDACSDSQYVYFGGHDQHFYKISKSGEKIWDYGTNLFFWGHCLFHDNLVITTSWDKHVYGFDRDTGRVVWKTFSGLYNYGAPELHKNRIYFATHNNLYGLDAGTGRILFRKEVGYLDHVSIAEGYLWTAEKGLTKRNLDGDVLATIKFKSMSTDKPAVGNGFFVVSGVNRLFGVSTDLKILWEFEADESFWSPGVFHNNIYYAGNRDSYVYALRLPQ